MPKVARIGLIFLIKFESETLIRIEILGWIRTANPEHLITSSLLWFMGSPFAELAIMTVISCFTVISSSYTYPFTITVIYNELFPVFPY